MDVKCVTLDNFIPAFADGATPAPNPRIKTAAKIRQLVESSDEHDIVAASKPYAEQQLP